MQELLYLASRSPRRQQLLQQIGITFQLVDADINEDWDGRENPRSYVVRMASEKARAGARSLGDRNGAIVLGADTAVILDDRVLGKAEDTDQARMMLQQLSGRKHHVYSAVAVIKDDRVYTATSISGICFRPLAAGEIDEYCRSGEPLGKAGGYAIQGRAAVFVEYLEGSYSGVVGLPLYETCRLLDDAGFN